MSISEYPEKLRSDSIWIQEWAQVYDRVPLIPIDSEDQVISATQEGQYLAIRCIANIDVYTQINFGRTGDMVIRFSETSDYYYLGRITGGVDGGQLSVAAFLKKSPEIITILCRYPQAEGMQLRTAKKFDHIVRGRVKDNIVARPILPQPMDVTLRAESWINRPATAKCTIKASTNPVFSKEYTNSNSNVVYVPNYPSYPPLDLSLPARPVIEANGGSEGSDQVELQLHVYPKPF